MVYFNLEDCLNCTENNHDFWVKVSMLNFQCTLPNKGLYRKACLWTPDICKYPSLNYWKRLPEVYFQTWTSSGKTFTLIQIMYTTRKKNHTETEINHILLNKKIWHGTWLEQWRNWKITHILRKWTGQQWQDKMLDRK